MTTHPKCKITVIKRTVNQDLIDDYLKNFPKNSSPCSTFQEGDEFLVTSEFNMPENFCHWAWADIRREILAVINDASYNWYQKPGVVIAGCTDWFRPVYFKIEKLSFAPAPSDKKFKAALFALDGTLVDFQWDLDKAIPEICDILSGAGMDMACYGDPPSYVSLFNLTRDITDQWISRDGAEDARTLLAKMDEVYDRYDQDAMTRWQPYPETRTILTELAEKGYRLGVVSNCGREAVHGILSRFNLTGFFEIILARQDISRLKPHPESLNLALQALSFPPEQVLFVGDSINDIIAADNTGMTSCFLSCGESRITGFSASPNVHHISRLSDLLNIL
ncbi:MAG: TIGR04076 family protein [Desulfotignum sp.]|nr:TIGR04076 family protein [Desulfotignum sp.]